MAPKTKSNEFCIRGFIGCAVAFTTCACASGGEPRTTDLPAPVSPKAVSWFTEQIVDTIASRPLSAEGPLTAANELLTAPAASAENATRAGNAGKAVHAVSAASTARLAVAEAPPRQFFAYRSFWPELAAMKQFRGAGVQTICLFPANTANSLGQPYSKYAPVWRWFGKYDFDSLDKQFADVLSVNPDAEFICMVDLNTPLWLQRQLSLRGQSAECESFTMLSCACANPDWLKATDEYLDAVVKHIEARHAARVRAYVLACGQTDEWMDYSRGVAGRWKTKAWKDWLRSHGKPDVPVPALERIDRASFENFIRDPAGEQDVVDYAELTGDLIANTVLHFAAKIRSIVPRQRQVGVFFGYILELTQSRLVWAGHLEYERVFASPNLDFFISPGSYADRPMGGGSGFMAPNGTRLRFKKGFLHEIDHRTPTYNVKLDEFVSIGWMVPWKDQAETDAGLKREFALAIVHQASLWCFDMWGGVFRTPETMKLVEQGKKLWNRFAAMPLSSRAEIALVVDPHSARYVNDLHPATAQIYQATRNKLNRLGTPFDVLSFNDLGSTDLLPYRLVVLPGLFVITPEKRALLERHLLRDGRTVLFVYAPGICDGRNLDPERVKAWTGVAFQSLGVNKTVRDGWTAVYVARYEDLTPQVLRQAACDAGVTIYCDDFVPVYANERLVAIHMAHGGNKQILLPADCREVRELFTDTTHAVHQRRFSYVFKTPDTALFEMIR